MSENRKKNIIVATLLEKTLDKSLHTIRSLSSPSSPARAILEIIFMNKPDQEVLIKFAPFDTWDKIKKKFQKLIESDGICVVCCEKEKGKKKIITRPCIDCDCGHTNKSVEIDAYSHICQTCCEYVCMSCMTKCDDYTCPVCRTLWSAYDTCDIKDAIPQPMKK